MSVPSQSRREHKININLRPRIIIINANIRDIAILNRFSVLGILCSTSLVISSFSLDA
jgi:hypothetical protein